MPSSLDLSWVWSKAAFVLYYLTSCLLEDAVTQLVESLICNRRVAGVINMGSCQSHSSRKPIKELSSSQLSPTATHTYVRASVRQESSSHVISTKQKKGHIMISYNWSNKDVLIRIRDMLKANGYSVWMDIDNMGGSTLEALVEAVEKSHVVLICMSQKYEESESCKKEAQYAYQLHKELVALKMEQDYERKGWLGFIAGANIFYDFSGKYHFETQCEALLKRMDVLYGEDRS